MMRGVINEGTGRRVRVTYGIKADMCGKTGTTQNMSDGWFMGYTPSLVTGCWVGGEERNIHFDKMSEGQGAAMALPIFGIYMKKVYGDRTLPYNETELFDIPVGFDPCRSKFYAPLVDEEAPVGEGEAPLNEGELPIEDEVEEEEDYTPVYNRPIDSSNNEEEQQEGFDDLFE